MFARLLRIYNYNFRQLWDSCLNQHRVFINHFLIQYLHFIYIDKDQITNYLNFN